MWGGEISFLCWETTNWNGQTDWQDYSSQYDLSLFLVSSCAPKCTKPKLTMQCAIPEHTKTKQKKIVLFPSSIVFPKKKKDDDDASLCVWLGNFFFLLSPFFSAPKLMRTVHKCIVPVFFGGFMREKRKTQTSMATLFQLIWTDTHT